MGQYYKIVFTDNNGKIIINERKYNDDAVYVGAKLLEHGYLRNNFCKSVAKALESGEITHLAWVGDYATDEDLIDVGIPKEVNMKRIWGNKKPRKHIFANANNFSYHHKFLINHTKRVYISFDRYINDYNAIYNHKGGWELCPFTILTAIGNGYGGGDYSGCCMEYVGDWAWDKISISKKSPRKDGYKLLKLNFNLIDITPAI